MLLDVTKVYTDNPKLQIIEMGKTYVKFIVENPEYLKFMFLTDNAHSVKIENDKVFGEENCAFEVFKSCVEKLFKEINLDKDLYLQMTLTMWSMVHGLAILISKKSIEYSGDYMVLVDQIITDSVNCLNG